jgi:hypothetical protein
MWARRLVWHAHDEDRLNKGQAGSRPGGNAIDVVIQKEMKYFFSTITNTGLATMDNNAKSCYDCIICNLAMIISQYFGVNSKVAKTQATTLKKMQFRLRAALGDSKKYYSHSEDTPVHVTGQGSCASPLIWLRISSILMDCLKELAGGMWMTNPNDMIMIQQWIDGFMNNTSLFSNLIGTEHNTNDIRLLHQKHPDKYQRTKSSMSTNSSNR